MQIDFEGDELISFSKGEENLPANPSYQKLYRWHKHGRISKVSGLRFKLTAIQIGGSLYTSRRAYEEFIKNLNARTY